MSYQDIYAQSFVWKRNGDSELIRYSVLMNIDSGRYAVLSADFFYQDMKPAFDNFDRQFIELMIESSPLERCEWYDSVLGAIRAHDINFSN